MNAARPAHHAETILIPGPWIVVVGLTGAGKTTTAARLARVLDLPHIELDALHWQPNWVMAGCEAFRQQISIDNLFYNSPESCIIKID